MAHHARPSASRFAQSAEFSNDCDSLEPCYQTQTQHAVTPLQDQITENSNNSSHGMLASDSQVPLRVHVERVVCEYFAALGDEIPTDLYALILKEVELPLLTVVLEQTRGNQTKCAQILGLNRGTLRKKLKMYNLMS